MMPASPRRPRGGLHSLWVAWSAAFAILAAMLVAAPRPTPAQQSGTPAGGEAGPAQTLRTAVEDNGAPAGEEAGPAQTVRTAVDEVLSTLRRLQGPENQQQRIAAVRQIANRYFDWEAMARSCLGVHWRKLDDEQRRHFTDIFKQILANTYVDDFDRFSGDEEVTVGKAEKRGEQWVVKTTLLTHSRERVPVNYVLEPRASTWVVVDFSVEGISQVNHYRRSFSRFLVNHSFAELMQRLERQVDKGPPT